MPSNEAGSRADGPGGDAGAQTLVSEAHHRIANNLQVIVGLVRLHASRIGRGDGPVRREDVHALLEEVAGRVASIGLLHQRLAVTAGGASVAIDALIADICERHVGLMSRPDHTALAVSATPSLMSAAIAGPVALIANELVTNAIKFAHPGGDAGRIVVACRRDADGALVVTVADDGAGLPPGVDPATGGGLGFQVMRALAEQIAATLVFEPAEPGLRARLRVPPESL